MKKTMQTYLISKVFQDKTGVNLEQYIHPFMGLDIVALGKALDTPSNVSMKEHVKKEYGEVAVSCINEVIKN